MMQFFRDDWALVRLALASAWAYALALVGLAWLLWAGILITGPLWPWACLVVLLAIIMVADMRQTLLPLVVVGLVAALGLLAGPQPLTMAILGAGVAFGGALVVGIIAQKLAGKPALGAADVWLAGALGCWLGLKGLAPWLALLAVFGVLMVIMSRRQRLPFAPAMVGAAWVALLHGHYYYQWLLP